MGVHRLDGFLGRGCGAIIVAHGHRHEHQQRENEASSHLRSKKVIFAKSVLSGRTAVVICVVCVCQAGRQRVSVKGGGVAAAWRTWRIYYA